MKLLSVLGDSISTFAGYNPEGYRVYYDNEMQQRNSLNSVYDTWWMRVSCALGTSLCVNNSYSGSCVSGPDFPAACCDERLKNLRTSAYTPDIILIYIGFNDFGQGVQIDKNYPKLLSGRNVLYFKDAYEHMLVKIRKEYPRSTIVCGTLMRTKMRDREEWVFPESYMGVNFEDYNTAIRKVCKKQKCCLADIASLNLRYETLDGSHPTDIGHMTIAQAWIDCLQNLRLIGC